MRSRVVSLAGVLAMGALACTGGSEPSGPGRASPAVPRKGGGLAFGVVGAPATLDPYSPRASDLTRALARPLYPSLFRLLPDGTPRPYLARSVHRTASGLRVGLRRARWSDGRPITAADVVASARRAREPSGFAAFSRARSTGARAVVFEGRVPDARRALASAAYVLPEGRAGGPWGGPYRLRSYRAGLEVVLERNPRWKWGRPLLRQVRVRFVASLRALLELLERGRLDAAAPPSLVNLPDVVGPEVALQGQLGWETVLLDFRGSPLEPPQRAAVAAAIDLGALDEAFLRDAGEVAPGALENPPSGRRPTAPAHRLRIAVPAGDELLELMQEAIFRQLRAAGVEADLVGVDQTTLYGRWARRTPLDAALKRAVTGPEPTTTGAARPAVYPLFRVKSFVAARARVHGLQPNPTLEGPLWNVERWWVQR